MICSILMPNLVCSGFFIKYSELPMAYRPLYGGSFLRYAFEGSLTAVFGYNREPLLCERDVCIMTKPKQFLKFMEMDSGLFWVDVTGLIVWAISLWILLYVAVWIRLKRSQ